LFHSIYDNIFTFTQLQLEFVFVELLHPRRDVEDKIRMQGFVGDRLKREHAVE
jgi:hypothetical protein